ncbi:MAG: aspartate/glutamate racemase family protein [Bacilli bacterium]
MKKSPIGILDMNIENISILNDLAKAFPHEHFIYVYDPECPQYEGLSEEEIQLRVTKNLNYLISRQVKLIVTVSSTIVEYCRDLLEQAFVPVVNIVDSIVDEVNNRYEHKNMIFLANEYMVQANLYQKNLRYNHLYAIYSDNLNRLIKDQKMKTSDSFRLMRENMRLLLSKDVDVIVLGHVNLMLLKTEIHEFLPEADILDIGALLVEKVKAALLTVENMSMRGKQIIEIPQIASQQKADYSKILHIKRIEWKKNN